MRSRLSLFVELPDSKGTRIWFTKWIDLPFTPFPQLSINMGGDTAEYYWPVVIEKVEFHRSDGGWFGLDLETVRDDHPREEVIKSYQHEGWELIEEWI